jgi:bifunctional pyridoxal-dependent enzyme with beta-cystathionase and maltose regulon repressor activities
MNDYQFLDDIYDILAQNSDWVTDTMKDNITAMIDYVDADNGYIQFVNSKGVEFRLQLIKTYAPAPVSEKEELEQ